MNDNDQSQSTSQSGFIDTKELLTLLPICRRTLSSQMANGQIPYVRVGRRVLFHWPTVQQALLRHMQASNDR